MALPGGDTPRGLRGWFSRLMPEPRADEGPPAAEAEPPLIEGPVIASKALKDFLGYLGTLPAPVLLDLGVFSGSNVTRFGQMLNCKVLVGDLFADLDLHAREGRQDELPVFLSTRFGQHDGTVDGVLVWDVFDYLERPAARALAAALVRALRPDGALMGFFGDASGLGCTRFVLVDDAHLSLRPHESAAPRQAPLQNRDILKMFDGLRVADSFLLQNGRREMLFRKGGVGRPVI